MQITKTWLMLALTGAAFAGALVSRLLPLNAYAAQPGNVPAVLQAREIQLLDEKGKIRAKLSVAKEGPRLDLCNDQEKTRAALAVGKFGPRLELSDDQDKLRAMLSRSLLVLCDDKGEHRAILGVDAEGPWMHLYDKNGKVIWKAP